MPEKSEYKRVAHEYGRKARKNTRSRSAENKHFFDSAENTVSTQKKSCKRKTQRSDHKHEYEMVLVKSVFGWGNVYRLDKRCILCGRFKHDYAFMDMCERISDSEGRRCYRPLSEEEILKKYGALPCVETSHETDSNIRR